MSINLFFFPFQTGVAVSVKSLTPCALAVCDELQEKWQISGKLGYAGLESDRQATGRNLGKQM